MSDFLAEAKRYEVARESLQSLARELRMLGRDAGEHCQTLINAAWQVEQTFDYLYLAQPRVRRETLAGAVTRAIMARNKLDMATSYIASAAPEELVAELVEAHICTLEAEIAFRDAEKAKIKGKYR